MLGASSAACARETSLCEEFVLVVVIAVCLDLWVDKTTQHAADVYQSCTQPQNESQQICKTWQA